MSTIEELLGRKSSGFVQGKIEITAMGIRHSYHATLYPEKLVLASLTSSGHSV
jgi:hypothetical protein